MKTRGICGAAAVTMASVLSLFLVSMAAAQTLVPDAKTAAAKPTPRSADGHPDFNGYYNSYSEASIFSVPAGNISGGGVVGQHTLNRTADGNILLDFYGANDGLALRTGEPRNQPSYKPEWKAKADKIAATMWAGSTNLDPQQNCSPLGVPRGTVAGQAIQILQTPQMLALLYENAPGPYYRLIYTDGRPHPKDLDTSYLGHSIGHWDGDTLVVDTVGLNDETWLGGGGTLHSDQEHVIERWSRAGDVLTVQSTVEDPVALTKPWVPAPQSRKIGATEDYLQPQTCAPNDVGHFVPVSETNPQGKCSYCVPQSVYGLPSDQSTATGAKPRGEANQPPEP